MKKQEAMTLYHEGFNCSQAVLAPFSQELNLDEKLALKLASGFGAGMRCGDMCGAVTGALMVLGLKEGHKSKVEVNEHVSEFHEKFIKRHGANRCIDLLGYDMMNPEEVAIINEKNLKRLKCDCYIKDAVEIVEEMIK